ncbi:MAG: hypothetical protein NC300_05860 [Bacteroidales bacterium]|nr:hypothetical protein [Clostridium sp.]MCM1203648.1 hypothetical protein [Bacteroidales bacterium]
MSIKILNQVNDSLNQNKLAYALADETIHRNKMIYLQTNQAATLNQQLDLLGNIKKNTATSGLDVVTALLGLLV